MTTTSVIVLVLAFGLGFLLPNRWVPKQPIYIWSLILIILAIIALT